MNASIQKMAGLGFHQSWVSKCLSFDHNFKRSLLQLAPTTRTHIWALRSRQNSQDFLILDNLTHRALISWKHSSRQAELHREKSTVSLDLPGVQTGKLSWCPFWFLTESMKLLYVIRLITGSLLHPEVYQHQLEAPGATTWGHILLICTHHLLNKEVATGLWERKVSKGSFDQI